MRSLGTPMPITRFRPEVCCVNFHDAPRRGSRALVSASSGGRSAFLHLEMLEVELGPDRRPWFVGFEWIGKADYLEELRGAKQLTRGANCTSADAYVRYRGQRGPGAGRADRMEVHRVLARRCGTERDGVGGHATRQECYGDLVFESGGPLKHHPDLKLDAFFVGPSISCCGSECRRSRCRRRTGRARCACSIFAAPELGATQGDVQAACRDASQPDGRV